MTDPRERLVDWQMKAVRACEGVMGGWTTGTTAHEAARACAEAVRKALADCPPSAPRRTIVAYVIRRGSKGRREYLQIGDQWGPFVTALRWSKLRHDDILDTLEQRAKSFAASLHPILRRPKP